MSPRVYSLKRFVADTRRSLKQKGVPAGVEEVRQHLERLLRNPTLLREHLGDPPPFGRHCIHHDPESDVYVLVHGREQAGGGMPHDHGPCWVVYGQYTNHTDMTLWERLDDGSRAGCAELKVGREVKLEAGHAVALLPGHIHSIAYPDRTFFFRITGGDVEAQKTLRFDPERQAVVVENRALRPRTE
jgi:predicted metal-dependent enzyme (double-stranded beta helix superfamily)